jgi:hypothetical protein
MPSWADPIDGNRGGRQTVCGAFTPIGFAGGTTVVKFVKSIENNLTSGRTEAGVTVRIRRPGIALGEGMAGEGKGIQSIDRTAPLAVRRGSSTLARCAPSRWRFTEVAIPRHRTNFPTLGSAIRALSSGLRRLGMKV